MGNRLGGTAMTVSAWAKRVQVWRHLSGTLALVFAVFISQLTNSLPHGPAADAEALAAFSDDLSRSHSHDAHTPTAQRDSTDHDQPTFVLIPRQLAMVMLPLLDLTRPVVAQFYDGPDRSSLLRPPRALA